MNDRYSHHKTGPTSPAPAKNNYIILVEIAIFGVVAAGLIWFGDQRTNNPRVVKRPSASRVVSVGANAVPAAANINPAPAASLDQMAAIATGDHIRGNPDAPVKIVEYSDPECPFCKRFHDTMKQIMAAYGQSGQVAWVYRHFPIAQLHPKAANEAAAMECANELGGNDKFWAYADRLYEITPSNDGLDPIELNNIAQYVGLDAEKFSACLASGKYAQHIASDGQNAVDTGGRGTPWSIVVAQNGKKYALSGAQAYASVKQLIEIALQEK
jgi:protein-disulfide isomerase